MKKKLPERMPRLPLTVQLRLGRRARQPWRVACFPARTSKGRKMVSRAAAWQATQRYGRKIGVKTEYRYTGWRACHIAGYHVWWAHDLEDLAALAALHSERG